MTEQRTPPSLFAAPHFQAQGEDLNVCRAAALYLAQRVPSPTFEHLSALLYLADLEHLSRCGALIFGGAYEALRDGPAPSAFLHLTRAGLDLSAAPDLEELSPAALEALSACADRHGQASAPHVTALTRGEVWKAHPAGQPITAAHLARALPNARAVLEHLADPHPSADEPSALRALWEALPSAETRAGCPLTLSAQLRPDGTITAEVIMPDAHYGFERAMTICAALRDAVRPFGVDLDIEVDSDAARPSFTQV
ncbi:hypothetical protein [Deinococcus aquaticus]|uniref:DUF4065 domain-containing protein n=1 Tax=Deinococcus aquaticus TaxID=328692 RepID=A0ABY7UYA1_9DEIO|nr:hypothetical protein [Deinococcus aquaticus]WDA57872.1 hypothetical protein M8445_10975 [Deinococcus aquaticus]